MRQEAQLWEVVMASFALKDFGYSKIFDSDDAEYRALFEKLFGEYTQIQFNIMEHCTSNRSLQVEIFNNRTPVAHRQHDEYSGMKERVFRTRTGACFKLVYEWNDAATTIELVVEDVKEDAGETHTRPQPLLAAE